MSEHPGSLAAMMTTLKTLHGPACPLCMRDDATHSLGCAVERYEDGWRDLNEQVLARVDEALAGRPPGSQPG